MPGAIAVGALTLVLAFHGLVVLARKARLRSTAAALGGSYVDEGWFRAGKIVGRGFAVRISSVGRSFLTHVEVPGGHAPGSFTLDAGFFREWPDWRFAYVPRMVRKRAFVVHVTLPGYGPPDEDQRNQLRQWSKDRRLSTETLAAARVMRLEVRQTGVSTTFRGIVTNSARLRLTLDLLRRLAGADRV